MDFPEGESAYQVAREALKSLDRMGIYLPERPDLSSGQFVGEDGCPRIPHNVQDLSDLEIGELYRTVQEYFSYVVCQLATVGNDYEAAKETFKFVAAKVRLTKTGKVQDKTDNQIADRRYVIANSTAMRQKCLYNLLSKVVDKLESDLKMISRNITLREQRLKTGFRSLGLSRRKFVDEAAEELPNGEEEAPDVMVTSRRAPERRPSVEVTRDPRPRNRKTPKRRAPARRRK